MAVLPVSNFGVKNNNNINFTGRKEKAVHNENPDSYSSSSNLKAAVPLMALLAMSPLSTEQLEAANMLENPNTIELVEAPEVNGIYVVEEAVQKKNIVASREFPCVTENTNAMIVNLVNKNGGSGFDAIELVPVDKNNRIRNEVGGDRVLSINVCNFSVISDDGVNQGVIPIHKIAYKIPGTMGEYYMSHDEISQYIQQQLARNPKKDVIPVNVYNRKLGLTPSTTFQNNTKGNVLDRSKGLNITSANYIKTRQPVTIKGDDGTYQISFYKNKADNKPLVTLEKTTNPGNKFRVALVVDNIARFEKGQHSGKTARYTATMLETIDKNKIVLMDTKLGNALKQYVKNENGSINFGTLSGWDTDYTVFGKGVISQID